MNNPQESQTQALVAPAAQSAVQQQPPRSPVQIGQRGLEIKDLDSLWRVSNYIAKSGLAPKGIETPEAIFVALEMGMELGLPAMAALQNIAVINGRPGVFGDVQLALVRSSGLLEDYSETEIGNPKDDTWGVECTAKRVGCKFAKSTFTVADAKRASLWGKAGPWSQYPKRMLKFRARGFLLRDEFGDVLKGVKSVEELQDYESEERFNRAKRINPAAEPLGEPPVETTGPAPAADLVPRKGSSTLVEQPTSADELAEVNAGLAPEKPTAAATQSAGPGMTANQEQLQTILTQNGFSFQDLLKTGPDMVGPGNKRSGIIAWDTYADISEFPDKACEFFIAAQFGLLEQLKLAKGGAR